MKFYVLFPEVAGSLGTETVLDTSVHPPLVHSLHYEFETWEGDDLVRTFPVVLASESLAKAIDSARITGYAFAPAKITKSPYLKLAHAQTRIPRFLWMKVTGQGGKDEIGLSPPARLVVSERVLDLMKSFALKHCEVCDAERAPDPQLRLQQLIERARASVKRPPHE